MPSKVEFTEEEYVLCTYAALYGDEELGGLVAINLNKHAANAVKIKICNIVTDMDEQSIPRASKWNPLTSSTASANARLVGWEIVEPLTQITRDELLKRCVRIRQENIAKKFAAL
jgi:hypothetical protein